MESIREIIIPENNKIILTIPDNFIGKRIEVIAFKAESRENELREKTFDAIKLNLKGFMFNREEVNER